MGRNHPLDIRLWSIHPHHLDDKSLLLLWKEGLLAQKILKGEKRGYGYHPQLTRFKNTQNPVGNLASYLIVIHQEAEKRGHPLDQSKIHPSPTDRRLSVAEGQIHFEWKYLNEKLKVSAPEWYQRNQAIPFPDIHPFFRLTQGDIEPWENAGSSNYLWEQF